MMTPERFKIGSTIDSLGLKIGDKVYLNKPGHEGHGIYWYINSQDVTIDRHNTVLTFYLGSVMRHTHLFKLELSECSPDDTNTSFYAKQLQGTFAQEAHQTIGNEVANAWA